MNIQFLKSIIVFPKFNAVHKFSSNQQYIGYGAKSNNYEDSVFVKN